MVKPIYINIDYSRINIIYFSQKQGTLTILKTWLTILKLQGTFNNNTNYLTKILLKTIKKKIIQRLFNKRRVLKKRVLKNEYSKHLPKKT